jgi:uroporphyrin-III C-methyltransferase
VSGSPELQAPPPAGTRPSGAGARVSAALVIALAALAVAGWQWWDTRVQFTEIREELARRLAESATLAKSAQGAASQAQDAVRQAEARLGLLEARLAESQNQQVALEAMYQELSRNRDETALAEVEQYLMIASQQLQLAGNVRAALLALQNADARLARLDRPQLTGLRRAIARDMDKLKALPYVDVTGISVRLDNLIAAVDTLPLAAEVRPEDNGPAAPQPVAADGAWRNWWRETWNDLRQLVRVRRLDKAEPPLLTPSQTWFLRENLRLRLLSARLSLLTRDQASFRDDLNAAQDWVNRYFDTGAKPVAAALGTLSQLSGNEIRIELPDVSATLEAVRGTRLVREKGAR